MNHSIYSTDVLESLDLDSRPALTPTTDMPRLPTSSNRKPDFRTKVCTCAADALNSYANHKAICLGERVFR